MTIINYKTGETIGTSVSIDAKKYAEQVAEDNTGTGAVRAGEWLSPAEIAKFGISADLTIYAE